MAKDNFYYFDDLAAIAPETQIRTKYQTIGRVLFQAIEKRLEEVSVKFAGPLPKIQYLIREHKIRENTKDYTLASAINDTRIRLRHINSMSDEELNAAFPQDLKAVCKFIAVIFERNDIPPTLEKQFPIWKEEKFSKRVKDDEGEAIESLRCTIEKWDDKFIHVIRADNGQPAVISYATTDRFSSGDWRYIGKLLVVGEQLNIVRPRILEDGSITPELIIFNPDYLINVTAIAACFEDYGDSAIWNLLSRIKPNVSTRYTLLGNFAGQLLDEAANGEQKSYAESVKEFFHNSPLGIACCDDIDMSFHEEAKAQMRNIKRVMTSDSVHLRGNSSLSSADLILEPSFFCETLGLQGRMDFIHLDLRTIIEQKSGKGAYPSDDARVRPQQKHYVQLLLYRAIFHYAYKNTPYPDLASYLLYSKYSSGLIELGSAPHLLFEAIRIRNQIAWGELHYAQSGMQALERINPETVFPKAKGNVLWERFQKPQMHDLLLPIHKADTLERAYYFRFLKFISAEHVLAKIGNRTKENSGFASVWNSSVEEKLQAGNIYLNLRISGIEKNEDRVSDISLSLNNEADNDSANFRIGDIVMLYPYHPGTEPDATKEIVFRSTITEIKRGYIYLRLRNAQHERVLKYYTGRNVMWAIEHDFMEASFTALYRSMHSFLQASKSRRDLILGRRRPDTDNTVRLIGDYTQNGNSEFNDIVLQAMRAKDIYAIVGPPGTGKTSYGMLNVLKEQLLHDGTSVLLMAYTNRAVDEICSKLDEESIDFLRLGNDFSCPKEYHSHLLAKRAERCANVESLRNMIKESRVVCGTTTSLNSHPEMFRLKRFELAIIDEASQILEPHIIGLLSARHGSCEAIAKFVLIGDEKQLPAVVQQDERESTVTEQCLNDIMLTDCRLSLFERMLRLYGKDDPTFCHLLTRQGRMHPAIAEFPNQAFYDGKLRPVPLPHQLEATPQEQATENWLQRILCSRRTVFVSCRPMPDAEEPDKMNSAEADIIADIVCEEYRQLHAGSFDPLKSVGVIVPYRNQITAVRNAIDQRTAADPQLPQSLREITIDTVERYQGSQRDLIIYGFTVKKYYQLAFLTNNTYYDDTEHTLIDRKLNVAMTRARKHLVMVGNDTLLAEDPTFSRLIEYTKSTDSYFQAPLA